MFSSPLTPAQTVITILHIPVSDLKLLVVLLHLGQFVRCLPLQSVELILQPPAIHTFLRHTPGQRGQSHRYKTKGQRSETEGRTHWRVLYVRVVWAGVRDPQEILLRLMFRSFSVSLCCSGSSRESFCCQSCGENTEAWKKNQGMKKKITFTGFI